MLIFPFLCAICLCLLGIQCSAVSPEQVQQLNEQLIEKAAMQQSKVGNMPQAIQLVPVEKGHMLIINGKMMDRQSIGSGLCRLEWLPVVKVVSLRIENFTFKGSYSASFSEFFKQQHSHLQSISIIACHSVHALVNMFYSNEFPKLTSVYITRLHNEKLLAVLDRLPVNLRILDIGKSQLRSKHYERFAETMERFEKLEELYLMNNFFQKNMIKTFTDCLLMKSSLKTFRISGVNGYEHFVTRDEQSESMSTQDQ